MHHENYLPILAKIANAGRWLFWVSLVYTIYFAILLAFSGAHMNPYARSSVWGRFRWYAPSVFELIYLIVPLFFLYFFQSKLRKGVAFSNDGLIGEGLLYLFGYITIKVILLTINVVFQNFIQPNWWGI
jgi:hypothetical protein